MTRQPRPERCTSCQYPLRHSRTPATEAPGTRAHQVGGLCNSCRRREKAAHPGPAPAPAPAPKECSRCKHPLRGSSAPLAAAPGTLQHGGGGLCRGCCRRKRLGLPGPALHNGQQNPPRIDVDEVAVDLAIAGARVTLNHAERTLVIESLSNRIDHHTGRPYSAAQIALMAAVSTRTVERVRARLREQEQLAA